MSSSVPAAKKRNSSFSEPELRRRRQQIVVAINDGKSDSVIARELQTSRVTVRQIRQRMEEAKLTNDEIDLCSKQRGSKPVLRAWQEREIRQLMANKDPATYFPSAKLGVWTATLVAEWAKWKFGITVPTPTMRRYMNKWSAEDATQRIIRGQRPPPRGHSADESLIWELSSWTLDNVSSIAQLAKSLGVVPCFAREAFGSIGGPATICRRIKAVRVAFEKLRAKSLDRNSSDTSSLNRTGLLVPLDTRLRRRFREELIQRSDQNDGRQVIASRFELPGVWSVRLVPVTFYSPAVSAHLNRVSAAKQRKKVNAAGEVESNAESPSSLGDGSQIVSVSQIRVLALAYDLRNGGYLMELFFTPIGDGPLLSIGDVQKFLGRLKDDIQRRGGSIHLPEPGTRKNLTLAHQEMFEVAERLNIAVFQDMPPGFPLEAMPYFRTTDAMVAGRPICRDNDSAIPYCVLDPETPAPFSPKPPKRNLGRPINFDRYGLKKS